MLTEGRGIVFPSPSPESREGYHERERDFGVVRSCHHHGDISLSTSTHQRARTPPSLNCDHALCTERLPQVVSHQEHLMYHLGDEIPILSTKQRPGVPQALQSGVLLCHK